MDARFSQNTDEQSRVYFSPATCAFLDKLRLAADSLCQNIDDMGLVDIKGAGQIVKFKSWKNFVSCISDTAAVENVIPKDQPSDFMWCKAHLALWKTARALCNLAFSTNGESIYVGDRPVSALLADDKPSKTATEFKLLKQTVNEVMLSRPESPMPAYDDFKPYS